MAHATTQVMTAVRHAIRRNAAVVRAQASRAAAGDPRAVHRVRVASRRLRAALPIAAELGRGEARAAVRGLRQIGRALGDVREADVVLAWLDAAAPRAPWTPDTIARVRTACLDARDLGVKSVRSRLGRIDAADLVSRAREVADRADKTTSRARTASVVAAAVGRRARQLSAALANAGTTYGVESLHRVRLRVKKLRYSLEAARGLLGASADHARKDLKRLQNVLGQIHDAQAVQRYARIAAGSSAVSRTTVSKLAEIDRALETRCRRWHARVVASRPEMDGMIDAIRRSVAGHMSPRQVGRMERMHADRKRRRPAATA